jgi:peptidoglycan/xylan/chitin deacetylase (PgdA/CDA1 family)
MVVSLSLMFEAGAQPAHDAHAPFGSLGDPEAPYPSVDTWFDYGVNEGVPRLLDLFDRHKIKVSSFMVGKAVERNPALAREIVERGHEAAAHGYEWKPHWRMTPAEETASYEANIAAIKRATGVTPVGFNAFALRNGPNTLGILQSLGFKYYIDELARDEPYIITVAGKPFGVVPYTRRNNDIERFHPATSSASDYLSDLRDEFAVLYTESAYRRRLMVLSTHDRIAGQPAISKAYGDFIAYALKHPGVVFMRKDEIARWAMAQADTPTVSR